MDRIQALCLHPPKNQRPNTDKGALDKGAVPANGGAWNPQQGLGASVTLHPKKHSAPCTASNAFCILHRVSFYCYYDLLHLNSALRNPKALFILHRVLVPPFIRINRLARKARIRA